MRRLAKRYYLKTAVSTAPTQDFVGRYDTVSRGQATRLLGLAEKIQRFLDTNNASALRRLLARSNFADVAEVMESHLKHPQAVLCFQYLNIGQSAQVLTSLSDDLQEACLSSLPAVMGGKILRLMAADDAVDLLQELDTDQQQKLLREMPLDKETQMIHHLMLEEPDTAAGIMSTDFIQVPLSATVGDALAEIRRSEPKDFVYYAYILGAQDELLGVISLKSLITLPPEKPLEHVMIRDVKSLLTHFDQEFVASLFRKYYNLLAMPVVDEDNRLKGIITLDDIVDVIDEETSEDLYRASGINLESVDEKNLLTGPAILAVKARLPWLAITVIGQLLGTFILASYTHTIETAVVAVTFMPLLTGLAGNMGTQSDTIAVRGLSQQIITPENIGGKLRRELYVALMIGGTFSLVVGFISFMIYRHGLLSLVLMSWILGSLTLTALIGMVVPYVYTHILKRDAAGVGGPFITTFSDLMTFSLYLYILTLLLPYFETLVKH